MEPNYIKKFLSIVNKTSFREYLDVGSGGSLSSALEERLKWAQNNEDVVREEEAAFLTKHRASLRSMVATMPIDGEGDWGGDGGIGEEFGGSSLSNPYMAFNMFLDDDEDEDEDNDVDFSEADTVSPDDEASANGAFDEDTSDEPTPLPGAMDFSHTTKQLDATPEPQEPQPSKDGPKIGEVAAYRNVSDQQDSAYDVVTSEVDAPATPVPRARRPKREKETDGRHIISGLRDPERLSAVRIIPETASRLRPYLLGALLVAVLPGAYMVGSGQIDIPFMASSGQDDTSEQGAVPTQKDVLTTSDAVPTPTQPSTGDSDGALADAAEEPTDEFIDVFNTETIDEAAAPSDVEAQEEQTQGSAEAATDVEPMDIFAEDSVENTAEDAESTQKQKSAAAPPKNEEPETSEEDRRKRDEEAKRRAEAKRQAAAAKKEEEARKAAEKEKAAQQTLVIGGGTTGTNGGNGVPSFNGTWKGKLGGQTCVFKVSDQSGVSMRASLKCISASSGQNYAMDVKGRYNSSKKSIYFQEVAGAGGWLRANVDRDRMWGNGSPHSGALKQVFSFTR